MTFVLIMRTRGVGTTELEKGNGQNLMRSAMLLTSSASSPCNDRTAPCQLAVTSEVDDQGPEIAEVAGVAQLGGELYSRSSRDDHDVAHVRYKIHCFAGNDQDICEGCECKRR